ncbi:hypothetical protein Y032_0073g783 [Ancylostoma ceylanicum]|uniref:Uncharacterized protein n=1 Tax=Ancylostoma ceylanicum TaxID=53326 RepID=A0A016TVZ9_9BILA|nr:hypothetical protein Y032_0073g783 [Ancylostoma ceylanicum]
MNNLFFILIYAVITPSLTFIIGGCIGPKSVLERHLNPHQKAELRKLVHTMFDGTNSDQVLASANTYVHSVLSPQQWNSILPELRNYQAMNRECSIYSQLLPSEMYKQLLNSVYKATQMGAGDHDLKRLVEDYLDRAIRSGLISQEKIPTKAIIQPEYRPKVRRYPQRITYERPLWPNSRSVRPHPSMVARPDRFPRTEYLPEQYGR